MAYNKKLSEIDGLIEYIKVKGMQLIFKNSWNACPYFDHFFISAT